MSSSRGAAGSFLVFVGTFRRLGGAGIYATTFDTESMTFRELGLAAEVIDPIYMALDSRNRRLFSVAAADEDSRSGLVIAYELPSAGYELREIAQWSTGGAAACHIDYSSSAAVVTTANYLGASVCAAAVDGEWLFNPAPQWLAHRGASVHPQRQTRPHPHSITFDPEGKRAIACDLGTDQLLEYEVSGEGHRPLCDRPNIVPCIPGSGPRHLVFHPCGRWLYVVNELSSTVTAYHYSSASGIGRPLGTWTTLPDDWEGLSLPAAIRTDLAGDKLFVSNRGHDSIVTFDIDAASGTLQRGVFKRCGGRLPRDIAVTPDGRALLVANEKTGSLVALPLDSASGQPEAAAAELAIPGAVAILFAG